MTTEQIKDLIASKIAGQGNQVDSGGALSTILNAIVDAVAENEISPVIIETSKLESVQLEGSYAEGYALTPELENKLKKATFIKVDGNIQIRQTPEWDYSKVIADGGINAALCTALFGDGDPANVDWAILFGGYFSYNAEDYELVDADCWVVAKSNVVGSNGIIIAHIQYPEQE